MTVAASSPPLVLAVLGVAVLVLGFAAVFALAVYVIKRAPKDGSDIGRDPGLQGDDQERPNGGVTRSRRP